MAMVSAPPACCGPPRVSGILYATSAEAGSSSSSSNSSASCVNVLRLNDGCAASSNIRIGVGRLKCSARSNSGGFDTQFSSFWVEGTTSGPAGSGVGGLSGAAAAAALEASSVAIHTNGGYSSRGGAAADVAACSSSGETTVVPVTQLSEEEEENAREWAHKPRRIALFVEPSPFAYVSQLPFPLFPSSLQNGFLLLPCSKIPISFNCTPNN
jgi:hypothetical protein